MRDIDAYHCHPSAKDWLLLVASRVDASGADSTVPLFIGLQEALEGMLMQMTKQVRPMAWYYHFMHDRYNYTQRT